MLSYCYKSFKLARKIDSYGRNYVKPGKRTESSRSLSASISEKKLKSMLLSRTKNYKIINRPFQLFIWIFYFLVHIIRSFIRHDD